VKLEHIEEPQLMNPLATNSETMSPSANQKLSCLQNRKEKCQILKKNPNISYGRQIQKRNGPDNT